MSRSGYSDDCEGWELIRWRGAVASAIHGNRGQQFIRKLITALDAMPEKRLIAHELEKDGEVCAIGSVGKMLGIDMGQLDPTEAEEVAATFDISPALVKEIVFINDEWFPNYNDSPEQRWIGVREWAEKQLKDSSPDKEKG